MSISQYFIIWDSEHHMKLEQWEWLSFYDLIFVDSLIYNILLRNNFKKNFELNLI